MNAFALLLALVAGNAVPLPSSPAPGPSASPAVNAVIVNSGSTNLAGYRIEVAPDGRAQVTQGEATRSVTIPAKLATQLYADLAAAGPLDALPTEPCMKSASFGSRTLLAYKTKTSGDLQCGQMSAAGRALAADAAAIAEAAAVHPMHRTLQPVMRRAGAG
jgi:hypothetical protein